jgi:ABC-type uncharacterized transport system permease subunit
LSLPASHAPRFHRLCLHLLSALAACGGKLVGAAVLLYAAALVAGWFATALTGRCELCDRFLRLFLDMNLDRLSQLV